MVMSQVKGRKKEGREGGREGEGEMKGKKRRNVFWEYAIHLRVENDRGKAEERPTAVEGKRREEWFLSCGSLASKRSIHVRIYIYIYVYICIYGVCLIQFIRLFVSI